MSGLAETARNQIMGMTAMSDNDNDLIRRGDAIEALKAANLPFGYGQAVHAITNVPAVQVTVKPLEWIEVRAGNYYEARVIGILYSVRLGSDGIARWQAGHMGEWREANTLEAALAAAQADYEARIRSALTIAPAPDAAKVAALVEAAEARARIDELEAFIADFASAKSDSLPRPLVRHPADEPDPVTDATVVWSWQEDANELLKGEKK